MRNWATLYKTFSKHATILHKCTQFYKEYITLQTSTQYFQKLYQHVHNFTKLYTTLHKLTHVFNNYTQLYTHIHILTQLYNKIQNFYICTKLKKLYETKQNLKKMYKALEHATTL
jgi:hypothetical protein